VKRCYQLLFFDGALLCLCREKYLCLGYQVGHLPAASKIVFVPLQYKKANTKTLKTNDEIFSLFWAMAYIYVL
jgi:hypothetical protein